MNPSAPTLRIALAGDTMLGRGVGERLRADPAAPLLAPELIEVLAEADLVVVNLECCVSERGERFPELGKAFFFRAPPVAAEHLARLGVDCVTLANNHALDFGPVALLDTLESLRAAGVAFVGAGADVAAARAPCVLERADVRVRIVAAADHPASFAARPDSPGVAFADLRRDVPEWLRAAARPGPGADVVLVSPHWGPNMRAEPVAYVRAAAAALLEAGATLIAGHSAHVPQGIAPPVVYDLGDLIDDYAVDPVLRNDLGVLVIVEVDRARGVRRIEMLPLTLEFGYTRLAAPDEARLVASLIAERCATLGTVVRWSAGRLLVEPNPS